MEKLKKLPIGIQTFEKIREGDYIYVDKTERIFQLVNDSTYYFLARPRRFGKSLLVSTLEAYFKGRKELFSGLAMEKLETDWIEHPVLRLDLSGENYNKGEVLTSRLDYFVKRWEEEYNITSEGGTVSQRFANVIYKCYKQSGNKVVLLIDEYDKPLIDTITNEKKQEEFRNILHGFYANIKSSDEYIRFALLTGVLHFSKLTIFSGLNNLTDISLSEDYYDICGISENELQPNFKPYIERLADKSKISYDDCLKELKEYYDGYHFAEDTPGVYNPFSLLNAFNANKFGTYWMDSGTPTFLVECLKNNNYRLDKLAGSNISPQKLADIRPVDNDPRPLFYQTGYLTIKDYDSLLREYTLDYPNREVKETFLNFILPYYINVNNNQGYSLTANDFLRDILKGNVEGFMEKLKVFFADIPYELANNYEVHYQTVLYILFKLLGFYIKAEYHTSNGRIDLLLQTKTDTYIIELKVNGTSKEALDQINNKQYDIPFTLNGTKLTKVGVAFNKDKRTIEDWLIETE